MLIFYEYINFLNMKKVNKVICNSLPKFEYQPLPYQGLSYQQVCQNHFKYVPKFCATNFKEPLLIAEGRMQYLFDHQGNRYQDWTSGMSTISVGHSHPKLIRVIQDQFKKLGHVSPAMLSDVQSDYAKELCQQLGPQFDAVYFANSGGQAIDFAIQLARLHRKSNSLLSLRNGYHGMVGTAGNVTNVPNWVNSVTRVGGHEKLAWPSAYRSHQTLQQLKIDAKQVINSTTTGQLAGIIFQPIQGSGGIVQFVDGYHSMICELVKSHKGLIICDEVQTGFGRIGKNRWGFKHYNIKPDIIILAKGIANGIPFGAVVTKKQIAKTIDFNFFNTTGGGYVQCVAGKEVLKIIKEQHLAENVEEVGNYLFRQLLEIRNESTIVGDTRGSGFFIGIQFVRNKQTKEPAPDLVPKAMQKVKQRFILVGKGGCFANVIRVLPPLCMRMPDAEYFIHHLREVIIELEQI